MLLDPFDEVADTAIMGGTHRYDVRKAEDGKFSVGHLLLRMINLVNGDNDRFASRTKLFRQEAIHRRDAIFRVADENDEIGHLHRQIRFRSYLFLKIVVYVAFDTAGIHHRKWLRTEKAFRDQPVAGDAGLIMDDGDSFLRQTVEDRGFADVWASHDRYDR